MGFIARAFADHVHDILCSFCLLNRVGLTCAVSRQFQGPSFARYSLPLSPVLLWRITRAYVLSPLAPDLLPRPLGFSRPGAPHHTPQQMLAPSSFKNTCQHSYHCPQFSPGGSARWGGTSSPLRPFFLLLPLTKQVDTVNQSTGFSPRVLEGHDHSLGPLPSGLVLSPFFSSEIPCRAHGAPKFPC